MRKKCIIYSCRNKGDHKQHKINKIGEGFVQTYNVCKIHEKELNEIKSEIVRSYDFDNFEGNVLVSELNNLEDDLILARQKIIGETEATFCEVTGKEYELFFENSDFLKVLQIDKWYYIQPTDGNVHKAWAIKPVKKTQYIK